MEQFEKLKVTLAAVAVQRVFELWRGDRGGGGRAGKFPVLKWPKSELNLPKDRP